MAHRYAEPRVWCILRKNPSRGLGCNELQEPENTKQLTLLVCKVMHARNRNPQADRDELCTGVEVHTSGQSHLPIYMTPA